MKPRKSLDIATAAIKTRRVSRFRFMLSWCPALLLFGVVPANGGEPERPPPQPERLTYTQAVVLGVVEGVTEFLPVSSTGHLLIVNRLLGLDEEVSLGLPDHPELTRKYAADAFAIIIQAGAIAAVALLYWPAIIRMLHGVRGRDPGGLRLFRNLAIALMPAVIIGLLWGEAISDFLFSIRTVAIALVIGAIVMLVAETWRKRREAKAPLDDGPAPEDLSPSRALGIGFIQCLAFCPGTSRSMVTILGGYWAGLRPVRAAEFSFLLGLPTLTGAAALKTLQTGPVLITVYGWDSLLLGCAVAAVSAAVAIRFLIRWLTRHGLELFAWYRIAVACLLWFFLLR